MEPLAPNRIHSVDCLRGIAALSVCLGHFTNANIQIPGDSVVRTVGAYGWLGVQVFFVISGFIIPYALHRAGYATKQYGRFLLKRVIRLDPPYVVTILVIIPLGYIAAQVPAFQGPPFRVSAPQLLLHIAYLNAFFGYEWLNPIFWTLAIEFQYYLAVGLLFPMIAHKRLSVRCGLFAVLGVLTFLSPEKRFLFHWLPLFMMGMLTFQLHANLVGRWTFLFGLGLLAGWAGYMLDPVIAGVGVITASIIAFARLNNRILLFLGTISYSLYLIHIPVGLKVVNFGARYVSGTLGAMMMLLVALAFTLTAAYLLCVWVEKPAQRWSAAIKYQRGCRKERAIARFTRQETQA